jgi:hypothetical protein
METKVSLPQSQDFATFPYPEPDQTSHCLPIPILEEPFCHYLLLDLPSGLLTKPRMHLSARRATCPTHFFLLDFISGIVFVEGYGS